MTTLTQPRKSSKPKSKPADVFSLALSIQHIVYVVQPIAKIQDPAIARAFRLAKQGGSGEVYDVHRTVSGLVVCDCPSYVTTHEGTISMCKHGRACVAMGLLDAPSAVPNIASVPANLPERARHPEPAAAPEPTPEPCCPPSEPEPCAACVTLDAPAEAVPGLPPADPAGDEYDPDRDDPGDDPAVGWDDQARWELGPPVADWGHRLPKGPDRESAAWEAGYTAGRDEAEDTIRDLELTIARLQAALDDARAELAGREEVAR